MNTCTAPYAAFYSGCIRGGFVWQQKRAKAHQAFTEILP